MIRVSFSAEQNAIDVKLPTSWRELDQDELRKVYYCMVICNSDRGRLHLSVFRALTGAKVERRIEDSEQYVLRFTPPGQKPVRCKTTAEELAEFFESLEFLHDPGNVPVRLDSLTCGYSAVNATLGGVTFGDYLKLENLYQGFMHSQKIEALSQIASILYPGFNPDKGDTLNEIDVLNILQWIVQIKSRFSLMFGNFFKPASGRSDNEPSMLEIMNTEIRVLTGGDVTKEQAILATDCRRALTELDFKAKEARDYKSKKPAL